MINETILDGIEKALKANAKTKWVADTAYFKEAHYLVDSASFKAVKAVATEFGGKVVPCHSSTLIENGFGGKAYTGPADKLFYVIILAA